MTDTPLQTAVHLDWLADRLTHVYGEKATVDFVQATRRHAESLRQMVTADQIRSIPVAPSSSSGINAWIDEQVANNVHGLMAGDEVVTVEAAAEIARGAALSIIADKETLIANLRRAGYTVTAPGEAG